MRKLEKLREEIDIIDEKILILIAKRMGISKEIGKLKKDLKLSALDKTRWNDLLEDKIIKGKKLGLSKEFIKKLYDFIHKFSLKTQRYED